MISNPILLALITLILWSTGGVFSRSINIPVNSLLYIITVFSALISFLFTSKLQNNKYNFPKFSKLTIKHALFASLGFGIYWLLLGLSLENSTRASTAMALHYSWPLFTALFFRLFSKLNSSSTNQIKANLGILTGFAGVLILFLADYSGDISISTFGAILALSAGASLGLFGAYSSSINSSNHLEFLILSALIGIIILLPWAYSDLHLINQLNLKQILLAIIYGIIVDGLGTFLWTKANRLVSESGKNLTLVTATMLFLPFLSAFQLFIFYDEPEIFQINYQIGLIFLLIGTALSYKAQPKE